MAVQTTLVLIKPDAVKRLLTGAVLSKLQESKLNLIAAKLRITPLELAKAHYAPHEGKGFYAQLLDYITGKLHGSPATPVMALVYQGENAIQAIRTLAGNTNPEKAEPDTVRGMFGRITTSGVFENVVHASATPIEAEREVKLWFEPEEILTDIYPTKMVGGKKTWDRIPTVAELG
jgi:nucleoside-diphosphate kinase